jgi:hypothetical protein
MLLATFRKSRWKQAREGDRFHGVFALRNAGRGAIGAVAIASIAGLSPIWKSLPSPSTPRSRQRSTRATLRKTWSEGDGSLLIGRNARR